MIQLSENISDYLKESKYIDFSDKAISLKVEELKLISNDETKLIRNIYHFVRDEIKHSSDVQDKRVTVKASDVMREKVGICWTKSNLLAAMLRLCDIPVGICYQRLTRGDTLDTGYCIHALNAVYIKQLDKWLRIDARGNKKGVNAEFYTDHEQIAFPARKEYDEFDYDGIYAEPVLVTMKILENSNDMLYTFMNELPESL